MIAALQETTAQIAWKRSRVSDGQRSFQFPPSDGIPGRARSLTIIDRDRIATEHNQPQSSRHFDQRDVEHGLFLREQERRFHCYRHYGATAAPVGGRGNETRA